MGIWEIVGTILYAFLLMSAVIYTWHRLSNRQINFKSYKLYIVLIGMMMTSIFNFFIINKFIRIILITTILMLFYRFLFKETVQKCVLTPIYSQILIFFAELIYLILYMSIIGGQYGEEVLNNPIIMCIANTIISIILVALSRLKFVKRIYDKLLSLTNKISARFLIIFGLIGMLVLNILIMISYYKVDFKYFIGANVCFIMLILLLIAHTFKTQNNYNTVADRYNVAKNSLKDYELMMTKYRIANHENKNMLLAVRAMVINKEKNIPEYIDSIIENKLDDDEKLLFEMGVIPEGGLRATMYSEILKIKDNKIKYNLNTDRKISTIDLIELDTNTIIDICKVLSVFIDNSIEATKEIRKRIINIDIYIHENKLCIKVSNNYNGYIDIAKVSDAGYTTKEKGHGYGLALVKDIIARNNLLDNETEINKNTFSQILKITYKKNH